MDELSIALCEIAGPVDRICRDEKLNDKIKKLADDAKNGMMLIEKLGATVAIWIPALMEDHKSDVYKVASVLTGIGVDEIGAKNGYEIIRLVRETMTGDVMDFFKLFAGMA